MRRKPRVYRYIPVRCTKNTQASKASPLEDMERLEAPVRSELGSFSRPCLHEMTENLWLQFGAVRERSTTLPKGTDDIISDGMCFVQRGICVVLEPKGQQENPRKS